MENRPEILKLIERIQSKNNDIGKIYSFKLDRISRSAHEIQWFINLCQDHSVDYIALKDGIDTSNPMMGKILISVFGLVSELELENIKVRVTESIKKRNLEEKSFGGRYVNLGYKRLKDDKGNTYFAIDDEEAKVIRLIFDSYIQGLNVIEIAVKLNQMNYKTRANHLFNENSIERILKNPIYIGKIKPIKSNLEIINNDQLIEGLHKPIISMDVWEKVKDRLKHNKVVKTDHEIYLFSGKLICYKCGARMYGEWSGTRNKKNKYYSCHNNHKVNLCDAPSVRADVIDKILIESLATLINSSMFMGFIKSNILKAVNTSTIMSIDISKLDEELCIFNNRKQQFVLHYKNGVIDKKQFNIAIKIINEKIISINNQIKSMNNSKYNINFETENSIKKDIDKFLYLLSDLLNPNNFKNISAKLFVINKMVQAIEYGDLGTGNLKFRLKFNKEIFVKVIADASGKKYEDMDFDETYINLI